MDSLGDGGGIGDGSGGGSGDGGSFCNVSSDGLLRAWQMNEEGTHTISLVDFWFTSGDFFWVFDGIGMK